MADIKEKIEMPYRRCIANGERALFHKWTVEDKIIIQSNIALRYDDELKMVKRREETGVIPPFCSVKIAKQNYAIIEDLEGNIKLVEPEKIKFEEGILEV